MSRIIFKTLLLAGAMSAMGMIPLVFVHAYKIDSISSENNELGITIQKLEQNIASVRQNPITTKPAAKTWDSLVELSSEFPKVAVRTVASPDQSLNLRNAWWGEISGKAAEVLSLMHLLEEHHHVQMYSFSYTDENQASALFYVIETMQGD